VLGDGSEGEVAGAPRDQSNNAAVTSSSSSSSSCLSSSDSDDDDDDNTLMVSQELRPGFSDKDVGGRSLKDDRNHNVHSEVSRHLDFAPDYNSGHLGNQFLRYVIYLYFCAQGTQFPKAEI